MSSMFVYNYLIAIMWRILICSNTRSLKELTNFWWGWIHLTLELLDPVSWAWSLFPTLTKHTSQFSGRKDNRPWPEAWRLEPLLKEQHLKHQLAADPRPRTAPDVPTTRKLGMTKVNVLSWLGIHQIGKVSDKTEPTKRWTEVGTRTVACDERHRQICVVDQQPRTAGLAQNATRRLPANAR